MIGTGAHLSTSGIMTYPAGSLMSTRFTCTLAALAILQVAEVPSRALSRKLTAAPRLAGTSGSAQAAREMARHWGEQAEWLGAERARELLDAFERLAEAADRWSEDSGFAQGNPGFYRRLEAGDGLPGRAWFRNQLWAPGLDTGYSSEVFPLLRAAAKSGEAAIDGALRALLSTIDQLCATWTPPDERVGWR